MNINLKKFMRGAPYLIFVFLFAWCQLSSGEIIILKSGKKIEGTITQETADSIEVDMGIGMPLTYYKDEIAGIQKEKKKKPPKVKKAKKEETFYVYPKKEDAVANKHLRILMIGNSYTQGVFGYLKGLLDAAKVDYTLDFPQQEFSLISLNRFKNYASHSGVMGRIKEGWDVVVLQDQSQLPSFSSLANNDKEGSKRGGKILIEQALRKAGVRVVLFATWARLDDSLKRFKGKPEVMQQHTNRFYRQLASSYGQVSVALVGDAFLMARKTAPEIELLAPDKSHPSAAGGYLAACVLYQAITRKSCKGVQYAGGLEVKAAARLQSIAAASFRR